MPQPSYAFTGGLGIVKWGNQAQPNGQGTFPYINLNDGKQWFLQPTDWTNDFRRLTLSQLVYRGRAVYIADDFGPWKFTLPLFYYQGTDLGGAGSELGVWKGQFLGAGEQMLTTDNATGLLCKVSNIKAKQVVPFSPFIYEVGLEFTGKAGWWQDLSSTTYMNAVALTSGSATNTNVTYQGSVWAEPVWTLSIPNTNGVAISSFVLANTMSGETLTINFPGNLAASTTWTLTIDSGAFTVTDQHGTSYDIGGSFPNLYGPAGQVQQIQATLTPASGTATGCTLTCSATNRWLL